MHDFDKAKLNRPSLHILTVHFIRGLFMHCSAFAPMWGLGLWHNSVLMLHKIQNSKAIYHIRLYQLGHFSFFPFFSLFERGEEREEKDEAKEQSRVRRKAQ